MEKLFFQKKSQDKRNYIVDFSKVKKKLSFLPKYSVEYGINEIIKNLKLEKNKIINYTNFGNYKISKK